MLLFAARRSVIFFSRFLMSSIVLTHINQSKVDDVINDMKKDDAEEPSTKRLRAHRSEDCLAGGLFCHV